MKANFLPRTPYDLLLIIFIFWFGSDACGYLFTIGGPKPLYSYVSVILLAAFFAVARGATTGSFEVLRDKRVRRYILWLLGYVAYGVLTFLESSQSAIALQALITLIEVVVLGMAFSTLMVKPRRVQLATAAFVLLAIFATVMNVLDFLHPTYSNVPGRAAGFYINPNISGYAIALVMLCGIERVPRRLRWLFVVACGIGVLVTFSRSAWIMWGVAVAWLGWCGRTHNATRKLVVACLSAALGFGFLLVVFSGELGTVLAHTPIANHLDLNTLSRLGVEGSSLSGESAATRTDLIWYSLQVASQSPLFGHGSGYVYEWAFRVGPHNMFLRFLVEGGVLGLLYYVALMVLLWHASTGLDRILVLQIIIASFFSHNLLESPTISIVIAFLLARGATAPRRSVAPVRIVAVRVSA